jgi:hypothetical protein
MEQLSLFDFPEAPVRFGTTTSEEKSDRWWLDLLRRPRDDWEDREEVEPSDRYGTVPKQEMLPGLTVGKDAGDAPQYT